MHVFFSLVPPVAAILGASLTKRIIPSLVVGLLAGTLIKTGSLLGMLTQGGDYLARVLTERDNAYIILFLFSFGALAEIFKTGGGISGFANYVDPYVKSERNALLSVWAATPISFLDCCFHVISTGTISRPLTEKVNGSMEKLAVVINTTSSQLVVLVPFATTYVGYILGVLASSMHRAGISGNPYSLYLKSFWLNFYSVAILLISVVIIFIDFKPFKLPQPAFKGFANEEGEHSSHEGHAQSEYEEKVQPRVINLLLPLFLLLGLIFFFFWWTGHKAGYSLFQAFINASFEKSIFLATMTTIVLTTIFYALQRIPVKSIESNFILGGTDLLPPIIILILAWAISGVTEDLGFKELVNGLVGSKFPPAVIPLIIFVIGGVVSYFIGSSWGTWALVIPLAVSLAVTTGANLPLTIGAVLAGGSIGDNLSPLGETPVLTASVLEVPIAEHIRYILPYGIIAVAISTALYLILGFLWQ